MADSFAAAALLSGLGSRPLPEFSTQIKPPKGKGKGKATASQEFDADGERLSTNPAFDLADRDSKSERFNNLKPGDHVIICNNQRTGHHDVTGKRAYLNNKKAIVLEVALWPNTWLSVRVIESNEKVKVRTSNIMLLADYESDKYKELRAKAEQAALLAPPGSIKPRKDYSVAKKKGGAKRGPKKGYMKTTGEGMARIPAYKRPKPRPPPSHGYGGSRKPAHGGGRYTDEQKHVAMMQLQQQWAQFSPCHYCGNHCTHLDKQFCSIVCNAQHTIMMNLGAPASRKRGRPFGAQSAFQHKSSMAGGFPMLIAASKGAGFGQGPADAADATCPFEQCSYMCDSEQYMTDHIAYFHKNQALSPAPTKLEDTAADDRILPTMPPVWTQQ